jgi:phage regulator Rha-like protein
VRLLTNSNQRKKRIKKKPKEAGKMKKPVKYQTSVVEEMILTVRGQKVILDSTLAELYGVKTKRLNEQVRRNADRFPSDFMFRLTTQEVRSLRSQFATSNKGIENLLTWQAGTSKKRGGPRYLPYAFTEHGAIMAANVLNSKQAVEMSVFVVRAFIKMREQLLNRAELEKKLVEIEKVLLSHDTALVDLYQKIRPLLLPPPDPPKKQIGFVVRKKGEESKTRKKDG